MSVSVSVSVSVSESETECECLRRAHADYVSIQSYLGNDSARSSSSEEVRIFVGGSACKSGGRKGREGSRGQAWWSSYRLGGVPGMGCSLA